MRDDETTIAKQQRWTLLVTEHVAAFDEVIRLANKFPREILLAGLKLRAEAGKSALLSHEPVFSSQAHGFGSLGDWGPNGRGPMIQGLLRSARFHAGRAAAAMQVAA